MKLRNKKTGEIIAYGDISVGTRGTQGHHPFESYSSLSKLNEEWEDYKPKEPLIKDEKIRKAVRAWAEANGDTRFFYNRPTIEICINNKAGYVIRSIKFKPEFREFIDIKSGYYTIAELCGEEKE